MALPAYYIISSAEASSNLAALRRREVTASAQKGLRICSICIKRRAPEGFGSEVKRRIMLGTYALSVGVL